MSTKRVQKSVAISCPSPNALQDYLLGRQAKKEMDAIHEHVKTCESCQQTLAKFDSASDSLVDRLRQAKGPAKTPIDSDGAAKLIAAAKVITRGQPAPTPSLAAAKPANAAAPYFTVYFPGYQILGQLGEGGFGTVYQVRNERMGGRIEALKTIKHPGDTHLRDRLRQEILAVAQLEHPNIIRAYDTGEANGMIYFTMEFATGCDLHKLIQKRGGPLPVGDACTLISQAAEGLQYAHDKFTIHRDVKPSNLILTEHGVVKVLDLGLARLVGISTGANPLTGNMIAGTTMYMAPEQALDTHNVTTSVDIFSLGCTLYFLLAGRNPAPGRLVIPHTELQPILDRMVAFTPAQRQPSMRAVIEELRRFCVAEPVTPNGPYTGNQPNSAINPVKRSNSCLIAIACVGVIGFVLSTVAIATVVILNATKEKEQTKLVQADKKGSTVVPDPVPKKDAEKAGNSGDGEPKKDEKTNQKNNATKPQNENFPNTKPQNENFPKPPPPGPQIKRTVKVGVDFESGVPRMSIRLESIELWNDNKMRWNYKIWNMTGEPQGCWIGGPDDSYVIEDEKVKGKRCNRLGHSSPGGAAIGFGVPNGENMPFWVDYQDPAPGARELTAYYIRGGTAGLFGKGRFPTRIVLPLAEDADGGWKIDEKLLAKWHNLNGQWRGTFAQAGVPNLDIILKISHDGKSVKTGEAMIGIPNGAILHQGSFSSANFDGSKLRFEEGKMIMFPPQAPGYKLPMRGELELNVEAGVPVLSGTWQLLDNSKQSGKIIVQKQ